jgi:hypothetical protein
VPPPRLLVLTDISSLTAGVREPDDGQSLIRLLLYANELDIEGLVASSNLSHGQVVRPELIHEAIAAYAKVRPNLLLHDRRYPTADILRARVKAGQPIAGPKVPVEASIGQGTDTEASRWIIQVVDRDDPRPVHIAIWGGSADLAQALWTVRRTRPPEAVAAFVARLRVHSVYDQDSTGAWTKENFPGLFYITRHHGVRGMYRGGDTALVSPEWVEKNVRNGHGPLGALYPNYDGGDIWSGRLGPVRGIKEGDTPSFLGLIPNGLNDPLHPERGGWGGRFVSENGKDKRWTDARDEDDVPGAAGDPDPRMSAVWRWRPAFQADFAARLDWCVRPFPAANHPPRVRIAGAPERTVRPGDTIPLDASASTDPDKNRLTFSWSVYPQRASSSRLDPLPVIENAAGPVARFIAPRVAAPQTFPILVTVQDDGDPPLTRYGRVFVTVDSAKG